MTRVTQSIPDAGKYLLISVYPLPTHPTHNFTHKNGGNLETLPGWPKKLQHNRPAQVNNRNVYTTTCCTQQTRDCCEPGWHFKFELIIAARHRLSRAFFLKNTDLRNCRYMDYMQESRATAACHIKAIAAQQVALQHVAPQSRCLSRPV